MKKSMKKSLTLAAALLLGAFGCAPREPLLIDPEFKANRPETIALYPVIDARKDKTAATIDILNEIQQPVKKSLENKGYKVELVTPNAEQIQTASAGEDLEAAELASLAPPRCRNLFLFYVHDASYSYIGIAKTFKIEASGVLLDAEKKRYLWRDKEVRSNGQGGLISELLPIQSQGINDCISAILSSLPKREG